MNDDLRIREHPILGRPPDPREVTIRVNGRELRGLEGEPVAAALLAHGIRTVRTMPETGEPRGIFSGLGRSLEEVGTVNGEANVPLMMAIVEDGMVIETQRGLGDCEDPS